jgi:SAM-dependent methyltransferase
MPASPAPQAERIGPGPGDVAVAERCAWCGERFDRGAERLAGRAVCGRCGVATTDPVPSEAALDRAYGDWYRPSAGRFSGPADALLRRTRGSLARRLDRIAPAGRILDVGAGGGDLVDALAARGRDVVGVERRPSRPDLREISPLHLEGPFAAVVFWHSLEHMRDARAVLDHSAALLAPGGVLVIAVPNAESLQARVFGDRWLALDLPRHLIHLPASALIERLRRLGLRVERVGHLRGGQGVFGWLHGLVGSLPGGPDLYDAIRRRGARRRPISTGARALTLAAGAVLLPLAVVGALLEALLRRGGSVYVEARRV